MAQDNHVTLAGNITKDPELRYTTGGRAVASFGLAVNRRWQQNGEWKEDVGFYNVVAWGDLGENISASLTKGNRAIVTGRLEQRSYETREGEKRTIIEVTADDIGPSLRWAQAQVERIARDDSPARSSGAAGPDPVYGDEEEPFVALADLCDVEAVNRRGHRVLDRL